MKTTIQMKKTISSLVISSIFLLGLSVSLYAANPGTGFVQSNEQGSTNGQPFHTLTTHLEALRSDFNATVNDLQGQIDDLYDSQAAQDILISNIQNAVSILGDRITELESTTATNTSDINDLQIALEAQGVFLEQLIVVLTNRVIDLEARVTVNEGDIDAIILADEATQLLIIAIQNRISDLELLVSINTGDISTLNGQITTLNVTLTTLQSDLLLKQDRVSGVCSAGSSIREIKADGSVTCETDDTGSGVGSLNILTRTKSADIPGATIYVGTLSLTASCPSGYLATGGGYYITSSGLNTTRLVHVNLNTASSSNAWRTKVSNDNITGTSGLNVVVKCGKIIP